MLYGLVTALAEPVAPDHRPTDPLSDTGGNFATEQRDVHVAADDGILFVCHWLGQ